MDAAAAGRVGRVGRLAASVRLVSSSVAVRLRFGARALALSPFVSASVGNVTDDARTEHRKAHLLAGAFPLATAEVDLSRVGRVGGVRTLEQRCLFKKQESQRWRLLFTTQVGLLRMMQLVQRSSPVKV